MFVFWVNMYFQLKLTWLGYVQTDIDYHMAREINPIDSIFQAQGVILYDIPQGSTRESLLFNPLTPGAH